MLRDTPGLSPCHRHRLPPCHHRTESTLTVSTVLLTDDRQRPLSIHPPDTADQTILRIPDTEQLRGLSPVDRFSVRFALWLLHRGTRSRESVAEPVPDLDRRPIRETEALTLLAWGLQRPLL